VHRALIVIPILIAAALLPVAAHDFWIEPSTFRPDPGSTVSAQLLVGENFRGDPYPHNDEHIQRFFLHGPKGEIPFEGSQGEDPAGVAEVGSAGLQWIGYLSRETVVDLGPDKLATYIGQVGLEPFFKGDPAKPIRDHFSRCAKSLLLAGPARSGEKGFDRRFGFPLELIAEADPYALGKNAVLPVRLLHDGKPLADALVVAIEKSRPEASAVRVRTDAQGRARLALSSSGAWLVKAVWIGALRDRPAEYESWWASLTFELPASP